MALSLGKHGIVLVHGTEETLPRGEFLTRFTNFMADALIESPIQCDQCQKDSIYPVIEREADIEDKPSIVTLRIKTPHVQKWESNHFYTLNYHVLPLVPNGFRYRCVKKGISGKTQPTWPNETGIRVEDGNTIWETEIHRIDQLWEKERIHKKGDIVGPQKPNGFRYKCKKKGKSGIVEPNWPSAVVDRIEDGETVWSSIPYCADIPWKPGSIYEKGNHVSPTIPNGFRYECEKSGTSSSEEPNWPTETDQHITDNNISWITKPEEAEWIFKEAHWVEAFTPPSASNVIRWVSKVLPRALIYFWQTLIDPDNRKYVTPQELERRRKQNKEEESDYRPSFIVSAVYWLELILMGLLFFALSIVLTPLLYIFWFLWWVPLGLILRKDTKKWWTSIPSWLHAGDAMFTNVLGDTTRIVQHGVWAANIRGIVEDIIVEMLKDEKIEDITVVAHSLGCAVVYDALIENGKIAREIDKLLKRKKITFISVGSALNAVLTVAEGSSTYAKTHFNKPFDKRIIGQSKNDFFWLDIWARFDPARFMRIEQDKVLELGVSDLQWKSRKVVNLDNPLRDHSYYWLNKDQVVPRIVRAINNGEEYPWLEAGITDKKLARHDKKVATLAIMRLIMIAAFIACGIWFISADGWGFLSELQSTDNQTDIIISIKKGTPPGKWVPLIVIMGVYALYQLIRSLIFGDVSGGTASSNSAK